MGDLHPFLKVISALGGGGDSLYEGDGVFVGRGGRWIDCVVEAVAVVGENGVAGELEVRLHVRLGD